MLSHRVGPGNHTGLARCEDHQYDHGMEKWAGLPSYHTPLQT